MEMREERINLIFWTDTKGSSRKTDKKLGVTLLVPLNTIVVQEILCVEADGS